MKLALLSYEVVRRLAEKREEKLQQQTKVFKEKKLFLQYLCNKKICSFFKFIYVYTIQWANPLFGILEHVVSNQQSIHTCVFIKYYIKYFVTRILPIRHNKLYKINSLAILTIWLKHNKTSVKAFLYKIYDKTIFKLK